MKKYRISLQTIILLFTTACAHIPSDQSVRPTDVVDYSYKNFASTVDKIIPIARMTNKYEDEYVKLYYDALHGENWNEVFGKYCLENDGAVRHHSQGVVTKLCVGNSDQSVKFGWYSNRLYDGHVGKTGNNFGGWAENPGHASYKPYMVVLIPKEESISEQKTSRLISIYFKRLTETK